MKSKLRIPYENKEIVSPRLDIAFKMLLGSEENKDLLADFLSGLLKQEIRPEDVTVLNGEIAQKTCTEKAILLDIRLRLVTGELYNIEMQVKFWKDFIPRELYYQSKVFTEQPIKGENYSALHKTVSVAILDFTLFQEQKSWYNTYTFRSDADGSQLTDLAQIAFLELPKNHRQRKNEKPQSKLEQWALFLSAETEEELNMLERENPCIEKAVSKLRYFTEEEETRFLIEMREKFLMDEAAHMNLMRKEGREEGREEGLAQVALKMKQNGYADEDITALTGLSIEEIRKL